MDAIELDSTAGAPAKRTWPRPPAYVVAGAVGWLALLVSLLVADGADWLRHLSDVSFVVFPAMAGASCMSRARGPVPAERRSWGLLAAAMWMWAAGGAVVLSVGLRRSDGYPFPSLADVGFLGYVVPAVAGLLCVPAIARSIFSSVRVVLDAMIVATALLFVIAASVLPSIFAGPASTVDQAVLLAYPVGDLVVLSFLLTIGMRVSSESRATWSVLGLGFICLAVADSFFVHMQSRGAYQPGTVLDISWASGFLLVGLAPHVGALGQPARGRPTLPQRLIPYAVLLLAALTGVVSAGTLMRAPVLFGLAVLVLALFGIRQVLTVVDEMRLSSTLDDEVHARNNDLRVEREFLQAVVDHLEAGVVACDADGRITFFNDAAAELHADADLRRVQDWARDLCGPDGTTALPYDEVPLYQALRGERVKDTEFTIVPPGATPLTVTASGRALYDDAGERIGAVMAMHDVTELRRGYQILAERDVQDELTGLGNRRKYSETVDAALTDGRPVAVLLIDLDDFKDINDSLGHDAGDMCLIQIGSRIRACVPEAATICRLGGDEFVIVLPGSSHGPAAAIADRLLTGIAAPSSFMGTDLEITASIGIALATGDQASPGQLLKAADLAMYRAKTGGKGSCALFDPTLEREATGRLALQSDLRKAVLAEELTLAYQPIVELPGGTMSGVEALVRWTHPRRGSVSPAEFIPLAEENGLIITIGNWVLRTACAQLLAWDAAGGDTRLGLSLNISARQLERFGLLTTLDECLATGVDPTRLTLEVTETSLTVDSATSAATLQAVRDRGVNLAVDDFGTGYSSLARLQSAPLGELKIDRSFISEIQHFDSLVPIVDATLAMARGLGFTVVAEGIETRAQLAYLRAAGCPAVQGFLLSRPLPAAAILPLMIGAPPWDHEFTAAAATVSPAGNEFDRLLRLAVAPDVQLEHLVRPLLAALHMSTGLDITYLARIDQDSAEQYIDYIHDVSPEGGTHVPEGQMIPWADTLCKRGLEEGPRRTMDAQLAYPGLDIARDLRLRSYIVEPVFTPDGDLYGTLCGASRDSVPLSETDSATLRMFARLISTKLEEFSAAVSPAASPELTGDRPEPPRRANDPAVRDTDGTARHNAEHRSRLADRRDRLADQREDAAARRDLGGDQHDQDVNQRDVAAEKRDRAAEHLERSETTPGVSALQDPKPALTRDSAAQVPSRSAEERESEVDDRAETGRDRGRAPAIRNAAAVARMSSRIDGATKTVQRQSHGVARTLAEVRRGAQPPGDDSSARRRSHESLDELTGAYLTGPGFLALEREMSRAARTAQPLSLAYVAIHGSNTADGSNSPDRGDEALLEVMALLTISLRSYDLIIRHRDDGFLCVLSDLTDVDAAHRFDALRSGPLPWPTPVTVRIGISLLQPEDSAEDLIARATAHAAAAPQRSA